MLRNSWRGVCLIAIAYVYFLIFAQFAFLSRLEALGLAALYLKPIMAAMALGGIAVSLLAQRVALLPSHSLRLRISLAACSVAAFAAILPLNLAAAIGIALLIGCALGLLTVTLVTHLRSYLSETNPLLAIGIGTGLGYFLCNVPPFFSGSATLQSAVAGLLCLIGIGCTAVSAVSGTPTASTSLSFRAVLLCFTALVWLDSAAFFIIQSTPTLKTGTWQGTLHLWTNGCLHFAAAIASAWLLGRRGLPRVLAFAYLALGAACLLLLDPSRAPLASVFYPIGVSLYSVALVAYPAFLSPAANTAERGRQAGWIYAIAGWFGSAMGIGMGQNLGQVPPMFVAAAGVLILVPILLPRLRQRKRELAATSAVLAIAFVADLALHAKPFTLTASERGRQVYISEGCIHCHSQYVRPNTNDVLLWGPVQSVEQLHQQRPPLIGNRRQGPDLAEVGGRRSPLWLKAHFYAPAEVSHASFMPSYRHLFRSGSRGDDLIAYLETLRPEPARTQPDWQPRAQASFSSGAQLFAEHCSTCHTPEGRTRLAWQTSFQKLPPVRPYRAGLTGVIKFGIPGTDMPGHEYLPDQDIASLSLYLQTNHHSGETH